MQKYKLFSRPNEPILSQACSMRAMLNPAQEQKFLFQFWRLWPFQWYAVFPALLSQLILWLIFVKIKVMVLGDLKREVLISKAKMPQKKHGFSSLNNPSFRRKRFNIKNTKQLFYLNIADISKHYCTSKLILAKIMHKKFQSFTSGSKR